jgi:CheY-like chemotaxis protein
MMNDHYTMPRILLVENDKRVRESYEFLLRYWGYSPILAIGEGKALIKDAIAKARTYCCILALIDLRLSDDFDEDDTSGLSLAQEIGPIRSIILSGFPNQKILREILDEHKDIPFMSKSDKPEKIRQILDTEVMKVCAGKRGLHISPEDLLDEVARTTFKSLIEEYPDQLSDLLAQLFPGASQLRIEKLDSSLFFSHASDVPRPRSVVLRVYEEDYEPVVVKLASAHKIQVEVERYEKYISRKVGGNFTARLERYAQMWDIGGALYSYIGDFDVTTFSRYYEEHPVEEIEECLTEFFTVSWKKHYDRSELQTNVSLFELYKETWDNWYEKRVKHFPSHGLWDAEELSAKLGLPNPIDWIKINIAEHPERDISIVASTQTAVTHGDLHGDNLLIDNRKNAWVIDFERSGEGHALQDFIELEADIINRLGAHSEDLATYHKMCLVVASQTQIKGLEQAEIASTNPEIRKALQTISILRTLACQCTQIKDARQYLLGLLFNTLFRATINKGEKTRPRQNRALILAGIFCHRLDHWNESWPPEEWMSVLQS